MLDIVNYRIGRLSVKLASRWEGPFKVSKASPYMVTLRLPTNMAIFPIFHVSHIRHLHHKGLVGQDQADDDIGANHGKLVTQTDDGEDVVEWRFERMIEFGKADNGQWQYLVK
jgi:hypothetical protein